MKLLQKILVPVDFHEASHRALDVAIMLSRYFLSEITVLHVAPSDKVSDETEELLSEGIRSRMNLLHDKLKAEKVKQFEMLVLKGNPVDKILHISESRDIDLMVIGEGNHTGKNPFKLGTTAEKLMLKNHVPLFVVKNEAVAPVKKILCPVDFSEPSKRALTNAIFLANRLGAQLTILNVFTPLQIFSYRLNIDNEKENRLRRQKQEAELNGFLKKFHFNGDSHRVKMVDGEPAEQILKEIQNENTGLLIMGTTGKTGLSRILLGSVTEKVTREMPCSFIITNESEISDEIFESNLKMIESLVVAARKHCENNEPGKAIEKYLHVLNQHPDNIPALLGMVKCYNKTGNTEKAGFYNNYIKMVICRVWGRDDIRLLQSLT